ncbi:MAG: hypothetical protein NTW19_01780, partial [Planctomycetota bacterium]|nr:hypothetical protein [Planctomycetota bacterium]
DHALAFALLAYAAAVVALATIARRSPIPASPFLVPRGDRFAVHVILVTLALLFAGEYAAYLWSPHDLLYHLSTSLERVFMQAWPTLVFLVFYALRTPNEALTPPQAHSDSP